MGTAIIKQLIKAVGEENVIGIARTPSIAEYLAIKIFKDEYNIKSGFKDAAGREHIEWDDYFSNILH